MPISQARRPPGRARGDGPVEHQLGQRDDQPVALGEREEQSGRSVPRAGWCQRTSASAETSRPVSRSTTGSTSMSTCAVGDGLAQLAHQREQRRVVDVDVRAVDDRGVRAVLGGVHRDVGALEQVADRRGVLGRHRDADRAGQVQPLLVRRRTGSSSASSSGVATPSAAVVGRPARRRTANSSPPSRATVTPGPAAVAEAVGDLADQLVADVVAEGVVDGLEAVQVDDHDRRRGTARRRRAATRCVGQRRAGARGWAGRSARRAARRGAAARSASRCAARPRRGWPRSAAACTSLVGEAAHLAEPVVDGERADASRPSTTAARRRPRGRRGVRRNAGLRSSDVAAGERRGRSDGERSMQPARPRASRRRRRWSRAAPS